MLWNGAQADRIAAARSWCAWEGSLLTMAPRRGGFSSSDQHVLALAEIETHYFVNDCFLPEGELLRQAHVLEGLPGVIVQGRYDVVTPPTTAYELHCAWPGSKLEIVDDAGHATMEPGTLRKLIEASDEFAG
jgi:proline iminopeptidase